MAVKINKLEIENVKRVRAVTLEPAKKNIAAYFDDKLSSLIKNGKVIVAE